MQNSVDMSALAPLITCCLACRLNKDPVVRDMEKEGDPENRLALRVLYGFLTYLDNLDEMSPAGTYAEFLAGMDSDVRKRLLPGDVYEFVERMTGLKEARHCFFLLLDEFNAIIPEAEVGPDVALVDECLPTNPACQPALQSQPLLTANACT